MLTLVLLIPPLLYATVNHLDKYLVDKVFKERGTGALVIFSSLVGLPVAFAIALFKPEVLFGISFTYVGLMILNGILVIAYLIPYFNALQKEEASIVAPLLQISSVLSLVLAYIFLGERLLPQQLLGCAIITLGSFGISIDRRDKNSFRIKTKVLGLMFISSLMIALAAVIFKGVVENTGFWKALFWGNVGVFIASIWLFTVKKYRQDFIKTFRRSKFTMIGINATNELIAVVANTVLNYALTLAPVAIVYFVSGGFQPVFALLIGTVVTKFLPHISKEDISKNVLLYKILYIAVIVAGSYLLI